jgi:hypothetical protein
MLLCMLALPARASLVFNGSFETVSGPTSSFSLEDPSSNEDALTDWSISGTPDGNEILNCVVMGGATTNLCGPDEFGGGLYFWVNPGESPDGGNYYTADGDQNFSLPLQQTVTGLVSGGTYTLSFYQAAAQQDQPSDDLPTTDYWQVTLGSQTLDSAVMDDAAEGDVPWESQTLTFTATAASEVLSFLAVGTNGQPPFALLDGVSLTDPSQTPEPGTFMLIGIGLLAIPIATRLRKKRR